MKVFLVLFVVLIISGCPLQKADEADRFTNPQLTGDPVDQKCAPADNINWVEGSGECLRILTANPHENPKTLVVLLHGDGSVGGPTDYLYEKTQSLGKQDTVLVGMMRPGYFDSDLNQSTGSEARADTYTDHNITAISEAISALKTFYFAQKTIVVGHSGGAAITGVMVGKYPGLIDYALLAACPCNIEDWRIYRNGYSSWPLSLSPSDYVSTIDATTKVVGLVGFSDDKTPPWLTEEYFKQLSDEGVTSEYTIASDAGHGVHHSSAYLPLLESLIAETQ